MHRKSDGRSWPARYGGKAGAWLLGVALAFAALFLGARAEAQTVTVTTATVNRATPDGGTTVQRSPDTQYYISYADCVANVAITFDVGVSGDPSGGAGFQVWGTAGGIDCSSQVYRTGSPTTQAGCVLLESGLPSSSQVPIYAQDLVKKVLGLSGCDALPGTAGVTTFTDGGSSVSTGVNDPMPIDLYFLLDDTGMDPVPTGAFVKWTGGPNYVEVDLWGPTPPAITLESANQFVIVSLPISTDTNTLGYYLLCAPITADSGVLVDSGVPADGGGGAGGQGGASGTGGAGGAGGGTTTSTSSSTSSSSGAGGGNGGSGGGGGGDAGDDAASTCASNIAFPVPYLDPPMDQHPDITNASVVPYICGNSPISPSSTSPVVTMLANGTEYVIGIVGYDEVNNFGPLSTPQCATPEPTSTFYGQYCADGGAACPGCGNCAVSADGDLAWTALASAAVMAVGLGLRRARSRKRGRPGAAGERAVNG